MTIEAVEEPVIVVVSALGGITDKLIHTSQMAANGAVSYTHLDVYKRKVLWPALLQSLQIQHIQNLRKPGLYLRGIHFVGLQAVNDIA